MAYTCAFEDSTARLTIRVRQDRRYKFHVMGYVNAAVDETRRAEFFRLGGDRRAALKGKRWLLLTRYKHLSRPKRTELKGGKCTCGKNCACAKPKAETRGK